MTRYVFEERTDGIVTVTLDSRRKLNALHKQTWEQLNQMVHKLSRDDQVRCLVFRGPDRHAFAAGADIAEFHTVRADSAGAKDYGDLVTATVMDIAACPCPTVALIQGVCVGGGLEIAGAAGRCGTT